MFIKISREEEGEVCPHQRVVKGWVGWASKGRNGRSRGNPKRGVVGHPRKVIDVPYKIIFSLTGVRPLDRGGGEVEGHIDVLLLYIDFLYFILSFYQFVFF